MFPAHLQFWSGDLWRGYAPRRAISGCYKAFFSTGVSNSIGLLLFLLARTNVTSQSCCIYYLFFTLYNGFNTMLSPSTIFSNMYLSQGCKSKLCVACPTTEEWRQNQDCSLCIAARSPFKSSFSGNHFGTIKMCHQEIKRSQTLLFLISTTPFPWAT